VRRTAPVVTCIAFRVIVGHLSRPLSRVQATVRISKRRTQHRQSQTQQMLPPPTPRTENPTAFKASGASCYSRIRILKNRIAQRSFPCHDRLDQRIQVALQHRLAHVKAEVFALSAANSELRQLIWQSQVVIGRLIQRGLLPQVCCPHVCCAQMLEPMVAGALEDVRGFAFSEIFVPENNLFGSISQPEDAGSG
jgi:hypothetical protein